MRRRAAPAARGRTARDRARASPGVEDREPAADVERVERRRSSRATARRPPAPGGPRRARHRPRRAASRRAGGCRAVGAGRPARRRPRSPPPSSVSVIPNFDAAGAHRQAGERLGRDVRVEPVQDVERAAPPPRRRRSRPGPPPPRAIRWRPSAAAAPSARGAHRRPQVGRRLADALERDPVVRHAGRGAARPFAARDDVGPEPVRRRRRR